MNQISRRWLPLLALPTALSCATAPMKPTATDPAPADVTFAWLTDTHIGFAPADSILRAVVADINRDPAVSFVVHTGDVTEKGTTAELRRAGAILAGLRAPLHIVPGNHDTKWTPTGETAWPTVFGDDAFSAEHAGWRFVGLNSGIALRSGAGHLRPEQTRRLDSLVRSDPATPTVLLWHHFPKNGELDNPDAVPPTGDVRLLLVGHGHTNDAYPFTLGAHRDVPVVMARSVIPKLPDYPTGGYTLVRVSADSIRFTRRDLTPTGPRDTQWLALPNRPSPPPVAPVTETLPGPAPLYRPLMLHRTVTAAPTITPDDNLLLTPLADGVLVATDYDRMTAWTYDAGGKLHGSPVTQGDQVVFGTADGPSAGRVVCLDSDAGEVLWETRVGGPVLSTATIAGDTVYIGASDSTLRALDLETGRVLWATKAFGGFIQAVPAVSDDLVVVGAWDGTLRAFNRRTGAVRWTWTGGKPGFYWSPAACTPVIAHGRVFVTAPDKVVSAIDLATGRTIWRTAGHPTWEALGLSPDGERLYATGFRDTVYCWSARAEQPILLWATHLGFGLNTLPVPPLEHMGVVYVPTDRGEIYALDPRTGVRLPGRGGRVATRVVGLFPSTDEDIVGATSLDGETIPLR